MLELSDEDFKCYHKNASQTITNSLETNGKNRKFQQRERKYKMELNGNYGTEKLQ